MNDPHYFPQVFLGPDCDGQRGKITINKGPSPEQIARGCAIGTTGETADANALLIASAPSLYEALEELLCWVGAGMSAEKAGAKCETLTEARTQAIYALADSRGEKPEVKP